MTAPALTSRIWGILFRNEWFKARKRMAFLLPFGFFLLITTGGFASSYFEARNDPDRSFALPVAWSQIFSEDMSMFLLFFASICLVMLVSSEFTWRTARQNVIDGVSKSQWFVGKTMLVPMIGILFVLALTVPGAIFASLGEGVAASGPAWTAGVFKAAGALLLAFFVAGSLALFVSLAVRGAGGAMAVWFLWVGVGEQLIIPQTLGRIDAIAEYLQYQPFLTATRLIGFENYDPTAFQRVVEAAEAAERSIPGTPDMTTSLLVAAGWVVVLIGGAHIMFRRRDL